MHKDRRRGGATIARAGLSAIRGRQSFPTAPAIQGRQHEVQARPPLRQGAVERSQLAWAWLHTTGAASYLTAPPKGGPMDETIQSMNMNEATRVTENGPQKGEFYTLSPDMRGSLGHGVVFENKASFPLPTHLSLEQSGSGIKEFSDVPRLRQSQPDQMVNDLDSSFRGYWLVSDPLKELFESIDSEAFSFAKCEFTLYNGSQAAPHYFCEVIREIDALDEEASTVKILTEGYPKGKHYSLAGGASLVFKKEIVGAAHIFRTPYNGGLVICDRLFRDALIEHGFGKGRNSRGVWLSDAADC